MQSSAGLSPTVFANISRDPMNLDPEDPITYEELSTIANTQKSSESTIIKPSRVTSLAADALDDTLTGDLVDDGVFAILEPQNRLAKLAFHRVASRCHEDDLQHHKQFIHLRDSTDGIYTGHYVLSLGCLPEYAPLGWRIGRGRPKERNLGVDILLGPTGEEDEVAGLHARFSWVKGGGGFFLIADNARGKPVILNGEILSNEQRMIPFRNTIAIGECYFSAKFVQRTLEQDEQFQVELVAFYSKVLQENAPLVLPTPSEREVRLGNWIYRNTLAKGTFGIVSIVSHVHTGKPAAAKELLRTPYNIEMVNREVRMAEQLSKLKHRRIASPFEIYHEKVHNKVEKARIMSLLDTTWKPNRNDAIDKYILYYPLSTATFRALIASNVPQRNRIVFFTQVLEGIAFLHNHGIAHRDIKPENLTVKSYDPPDAMIVDFGSAMFDERILYDWCGTIPYLAPEQREGQYHGRTVDYWACALVGIQLLGHRAPSSQVTGSTLSRIHSWLDKNYTNPIAVVSKGMLQVRPDDRMTADYALGHILAEYVEPFTEKRPLSGGEQMAETAVRRQL